jgi:hypothetical protein
MRFNSARMAVFASVATLAFGATGAASAGGPGVGPTGAGSLPAVGAPRAIVAHPGAARVQGIQPGRWVGGNGFGGPGQHWEGGPRGFRPGGAIRRNLGAAPGGGHAFRRPPGYFGGGVYGGGYYGGPGVISGYYGGNGVYYMDNGYGYSDESYRPAAYSAIDVYAPTFEENYNQTYVAPVRIIERGGVSAPETAYKPLRHIYYLPTAQFRPKRKNCHCSNEQ